MAHYINILSTKGLANKCFRRNTIPVDYNTVSLRNILVYNTAEDCLYAYKVLAAFDIVYFPFC